MPVITLPDGSQKSFAFRPTVLQLAESIAPSLAKAALAGEVDGHLVDVSYEINQDASVRIITAKDPESLEVIRHSSAHLLAQAVKQLFPGAQVTIGPVIENGFYYDFAFERAFTEEDLRVLEQRMQELSRQKIRVSRQTLPRDQAIAYFKKLGEYYKAEIIASIPQDEVLSLYSQGDFTDLCRGPHVPHTGFLSAFKLMSVAGAYWRGDSKNPMLQRIYGTAWRNQDELNAYLKQLEEAEKRDHRKLGKQLDLFHLQEEAPGMVFWHENGWIIWQVIEQYLRQRLRQHNYQEIKTPQVLDISLWQRSGHADKYLENMFLTHSENRDYAVKPMSCPCHVQVYNQGLKSYRDLPIRYAEFGSCHRNETSGSLHGLLRVRSMVQDDGHIFCTEDQVESEVIAFMQQAFQVYRAFGFTDLRIKLATRPEQRIGSDEMWDQAEQSLAEALTKSKIEFDYLPGEGAFYGPKIELHLADAIGRNWQCGTMQVDFNLPKRLGAEYVAEDNTRAIPVMLHRAIFGSFERFIGMLIEHYAGEFPLWLAPVQIVVMAISDKFLAYAGTVVEDLKQAGLRVKLDARNEKLGFKIRENTLKKIPYLLIVGEQEQAKGVVAMRSRKGEDLGTMTVAAALMKFKEEVR